ncbi:hypothetical protein HOLleu_15131 [Holothuria leucospilota]|uniref:Uncharacterized protein n=1 Tax=Holothuria leucospilota TaxID=206669 RepID=A0A9Q1CA04_HOLLE|nr:hypothetical protein HOLleu_15131 [Holothuria leucospilota]
MEYASLCWMNASPTTLSQLDNIQKKALKITSVDDITAQMKLSIPTLDHRQWVAADITLHKMHTSICPTELKTVPPPPLIRHCVTRTRPCSHHSRC